MMQKCGEPKQPLMLPSLQRTKYETRFFRLTQIPGERPKLTPQRVFVRALLVSACAGLVVASVPAVNKGAELAKGAYTSSVQHVEEWKERRETAREERIKAELAAAAKRDRAEIEQNRPPPRQFPAGMPDYAKASNLSDQQYVLFFSSGQQSYAQRIANARGEGAFVKRCFEEYSKLCRMTQDEKMPEKERLAAAQIVSLMSRVSTLDRGQFRLDAVYQLFKDLLDERNGARGELAAGKKESASAMANVLFRKNGRIRWGLVKSNGHFLWYRSTLDQIVPELSVQLSGEMSGNRLTAYDLTADVKWWEFQAPVEGSMSNISRAKGFLSYERGVGTYTLTNGKKITLRNSGTIHNIYVYADGEPDFICSVIRETGETKEVFYLK